VSSSRALVHTCNGHSSAWLGNAAAGHKNHSSRGKLPHFSRTGQCKRITGKSQSFPSGRWKWCPVPGSRGDTGTCWWGLVVGSRENPVLSEEMAVVVGRWWLCAAQLAATPTEHPGLFQPSLYRLQVENCFQLLYLRVVWAEYFIAAA